MVCDRLDQVRFLELFDDVIVAARPFTPRQSPRIFIFGECVNVLVEQDNTKSALEIEKLCNKLTELHDDVDILCGYSSGTVESGMDNITFQQLCDQHSAVIRSNN